MRDCSAAMSVSVSKSESDGNMSVDGESCPLIFTSGSSNRNNSVVTCNPAECESWQVEEGKEDGGEV